MNISGLIARRYGQHRSIVFINGNTLKEVKYVLKTQSGVSEKSYQYFNLFSIHGSGQGAGNFPGIWCCISSNIFVCYKKKANGEEFYYPDMKVQCNMFMTGFFDETSGSTDSFFQPSQMPLQHYATLAEVAQH